MGRDLLNDGGRYNVAANTWTNMSTASRPEATENRTAVWTGTEMIVWDGGYSVNGGGRYNPVSNAWRRMSRVGQPSDRAGYSTVWTGREMIVWGGYNSSGLFANTFNDGRRYDPVLDQWSPISHINAPAPRFDHTAVWTGTEMIVWGGGYTFQSYNPANGQITSTNRLWSDGARYNPANNTWTTITTNSAPTARTSHAALWTGDEMIVWGGFGQTSQFNNGGRYDPAPNRWIPITTSGAPTRSRHSVIWTGSDMLVWGGIEEHSSDIWSYMPNPPSLSIVRTNTNRVSLGWPFPFTGFGLERISALALPNWTTVSNAPVQIGNRWQVTLEAGQDESFFRLRKGQ